MVLNFIVRLENGGGETVKQERAHSITALSEEKEAKQGPH